jgi:heme-degrading monooxygenase HmoA
VHAAHSGTRRDSPNIYGAPAVHDAAATPGFRDAQMLVRDADDDVEFVLITYWESMDTTKAFTGDDIEVARPYPGDEVFELQSDNSISHYAVAENFPR